MLWKIVLAQLIFFLIYRGCIDNKYCAQQYEYNILIELDDSVHDKDHGHINMVTHLSMTVCTK
jgi:hypothetical protein